MSALESPYPVLTRQKLRVWLDEARDGHIELVDNKGSSEKSNHKGSSLRTAGGVRSVLPFKSRPIVRRNIEMRIDKLHEKLLELIMDATRNGPIRSQEQVFGCNDPTHRTEGLCGQVEKIIRDVVLSNRKVAKKNAKLIAAIRRELNRIAQYISDLQLPHESDLVITSTLKEENLVPDPREQFEYLWHDSPESRYLYTLETLTAVCLKHIRELRARCAQPLISTEDEEDVKGPAGEEAVMRILDTKQETITDGNFAVLAGYITFLTSIIEEVAQEAQEALPPASDWDNIRTKFGERIRARKNELSRICEGEALEWNHARPTHKPHALLERILRACTENIVHNVDKISFDEMQHMRSGLMDARAVLLPNTAAFLKDRQCNPDAPYAFEPCEKEFLRERYIFMRFRSRRPGPGRLRLNISMRGTLAMEMNCRFKGGLPVATRADIDRLCQEFAAEIPDERQKHLRVLDAIRAALETHILKHILQHVATVLDEEGACQMQQIPGTETYVRVIGGRVFDCDALIKRLQDIFIEYFAEHEEQWCRREFLTEFPDGKKCRDLANDLANKTRSLLERQGYTDRFPNIRNALPSSNPDLRFARDMLGASRGKIQEIPEQFDTSRIVARYLLNGRDGTIETFPLLKKEQQLLEDLCNIERQRYLDLGDAPEAIFLTMQESEILDVWANQLNMEFHANYPFRSGDDIAQAVEAILATGIQPAHASTHVETSALPDMKEDSSALEQPDADKATPIQIREDMRQIIRDIDDVCGWVESWSEKSGKSNIPFRILMESITQRLRIFSNFVSGIGVHNDSLPNTLDEITSDLVFLQLVRDGGVISANRRGWLVSGDKDTCRSVMKRYLEQRPNIRIEPGVITPNLEKIIQLIRDVHRRMDTSAAVLSSLQDTAAQLKRAEEERERITRDLDRVEYEKRDVLRFLAGNADSISQLEEDISTIHRDILRYKEVYTRMRNGLRDAQEQFRDRTEALAALTRDGVFEPELLSKAQEGIAAASQGLQAAQDALQFIGIPDGQTPEEMENILNEAAELCGTSLGKISTISSTEPASNSDFRDVKERLDTLLAFVKRVHACRIAVGEAEGKKATLQKQYQEVNTRIERLQEEDARREEALERLSGAREYAKQIDDSFAKLIHDISTDSPDI